MFFPFAKNRKKEIPFFLCFSISLMKKHYTQLRGMRQKGFFFSLFSIGKRYYTYIIEID